MGAGVFGATFAIQAPVANLAAGFVILIARPFKIGDTIAIQNQYGVVENIKLAQTVLVDEDGVKIFIPNKHVIGESVQNSEEFRMMESSVGISYSSDPSVAISLVQNALSDIELLVKNKPPQVGIEQFGASSITISWRCWVPSDKFHELLFASNKCVFEVLKANGIQIPFPQMDVTIKK